MAAIAALKSTKQPHSRCKKHGEVERGQRFNEI